MGTRICSIPQKGHRDGCKTGGIRYVLPYSNTIMVHHQSHKQIFYGPGTLLWNEHSTGHRLS